MSEIQNKQPEWKPGRQLARPRFALGGKKSVARLEQLRYDPIGELVSNYRKLEAELDRQEKIRDGLIVELTGTGKPKSYRPEIHHAIYDKMIAISDKLLRYGYGRVPETQIVEEKKPMPLIVNLTKKGEVYIANDIDSEEFNPDEELEDEYQER